MCGTAYHLRDFYVLYIYIYLCIYLHKDNNLFANNALLLIGHWGSLHTRPVRMQCQGLL